MKRTLAVLALCCTSSLYAEDVLTNQGGTAITSGDWVDVTSTVTGLTGTTIPFYVTGWDKYMYVPAIDAYCGIGSYYQPSSEPNQNWSCYSFTENRWWLVSMSGLFADEHLQEGGHPMGNVQVDPATSIALGFQGSSGSQVSNQTKYGMWRYDFMGNVGIPQQPLMGATVNNQLGTSTYDAARMLQIGFGGDGSSQGHYQYDNNRTHSTCTSNGYNCYNSWSLEMSVTLNGLPVAITQPSMTEDTINGNVYLFGGFYSAAGHNGVWQYVPGTGGAAGTWTNVFADATTSTSCHDRLGGNNCPVGRIDEGWAYDAADNIIMMTGGAIPNTSTGSPQTPLNDTWVFDPVSVTWTQIGFTNLTAHTMGYGEASVALASSIISTDTTLSFSSAYSYTVTASTVQPVIFQIDSEFIECTAQSSQTAFSSCTRGFENTTPASHSSTTLVYNSAPLTGSNERLAWLPEHNVFLLFSNPLHSGGSAHMYALAYVPGEHYGYKSRSYGYTASDAGIGPLNRNTTDAADEGWVYSETVASDGTNLFIGHTETATKQTGATPSNSWLPHPYVQQFGGSSPCGNLDSGYICDGSAYSSISPDLNSNATSSYQMNCAVISANPWCYFYQTNTSTAGGGGTSLATVGMAVGWNGTSWSLGSQLPVVSTAAGYAGPGQIIAVGTTPTVINIEQDHSGSITGNQNPYATYCYVRQWNGTSWTILGGAALNSGYSFCEEPTIATDGTNIWAAFTYHKITFSSAAGDNGIWTGPPQLQLWLWNGSTWTQQGTSGNILGSSCDGTLTGTAPPVPTGSACSRAFNPSLTILGGVPYVAFTERSDQQTYQKLELRKFSSGVWSTVVADLRRDSNTGWAFRPELTNDGTNLFLAWDEQANEAPWAGTLSLASSGSQKDRVYVDQITTSGTATKLGGSLNADTTNGSASHPSVAIYNSNPVVTWGEVKIGAARQLYAKQWNGTDWAAIAASGALLTNPVSFSGSVVFSGGTSVH